MKTKIENQNIRCNYVGIVITVLVFHCKNCNYAFQKTIPGLITRLNGKWILSQKGCLDTEYKPFSCKRCGSEDIHLFKSI